MGWLAPRPGRFTLRERDPVPIVPEAGWAPGPVWTAAENLVPTGIRSPVRPARSESLYRLSYRGPIFLLLLLLLLLLLFYFCFIFLIWCLFEIFIQLLLCLNATLRNRRCVRGHGSEFHAFLLVRLRFIQCWCKALLLWQHHCES
jgi:hypothetical protein